MNVIPIPVFTMEVVRMESMITPACVKMAGPVVIVTQQMIIVNQANALPLALMRATTCWTRITASE